MTAGAPAAADGDTPFVIDPRETALRLALVGCGTIGLELIRLLRLETSVSLEAIVVRPERLEICRELLRPFDLSSKVVSELGATVDLLLEAGGHSAIAEHVVPALHSGVSCVLASVGALASRELLQEVQRAARAGRAQVQLIPGAIGGIDALSAGRLCGLDEVIYTGTKPPSAWRGTPAEHVLPLDRLESAAVVFEGSAREAAMLYPKNANVTATIALAGLGFEATRVRLVADPSVRQNIHRLHARGRFGEFDMTLSNVPLVSNPKTSALTLYSALRAVANEVNLLSI
jgi:aspartate dehydrogenase